MAVLAKNGVLLVAFVTEVDFRSQIQYNGSNVKFSITLCFIKGTFKTTMIFSLNISDNDFFKTFKPNTQEMMIFKPHDCETLHLL